MGSYWDVCGLEAWPTHRWCVRVAERNADTRHDRYRRPIETTEHGNGGLELENMNAAQSALELWCTTAAARYEEPSVKNDAIFSGKFFPP